MLYMFLATLLHHINWKMGLEVAHDRCTLPWLIYYWIKWEHLWRRSWTSLSLSSVGDRLHECITALRVFMEHSWDRHRWFCHNLYLQFPCLPSEKEAISTRDHSRISGQQADPYSSRLRFKIKTHIQISDLQKDRPGFKYRSIISFKFKQF